MDQKMQQLQQSLVEIEIEAEQLLLARHQVVENDKIRNGNREALTALRKRARTTKTSVASPFESLMREIEGPESRPLVKEVCTTCGNHDSVEKTWMMFPGTDILARVPFHAAHSVIEKNQSRLEHEANKLQSYVKEKSFSISEKGVLADKISPGVLRSLVTLSDKPKAQFTKQCVISQPKGTVYKRIESDHFIILASDGLWGVLSKDFACDVVSKCLAGNFSKRFFEETNANTSREAATMLAELAIARGSKDNITVIVVELNTQ